MKNTLHFESDLTGSGQEIPCANASNPLGRPEIAQKDDSLDGSAIHPESYAIAEAMLERAEVTMETDADERAMMLEVLQEQESTSELAADLGTGIHTLADILEQLARPGRDPREDLPAPVLRSDVLTMEDL